MDSLWTELPLELSEKICNSLTKVRTIQESIKTEIESQRWMLAKIFSWYFELCQFNHPMALSTIRRDLGVPVNVDINVHWNTMTPDERIDFFYSPYGPGTEEGKELIARHKMYREWVEETRDF